MSIVTDNSFDTRQHPRDNDNGKFVQNVRAEDPNLKLSATDQVIQRMFDQGVILRDAKATAAAAARDAVIAKAGELHGHGLLFRWYDGGDGPHLVFVGARDPWGEFETVNDTLHQQMSEAASLITDYSWLASEPAFYAEDDEHYTVFGDSKQGKILALERDTGSAALSTYLTWISRWEHTRDDEILGITVERADKLVEGVVDPSLDAIVYSLQDQDETITVNPDREDEVLAHLNNLIGTSKRAPLREMLAIAYSRGEVDDDTWLNVNSNDLNYLYDTVEQFGSKLRAQLRALNT